jgi:hypothetical protein
MTGIMKAMGLFRPAALSPDEVEVIVQKKVRWILAACHPHEIWLFGSAAQGRMTEASDVDLALLFSDRSALLAGRRELYETKRPDEWPQDLVFFVADDFYRQSAVGGLPMLILRDGKRTYPEAVA